MDYIGHYDIAGIIILLIAIVCLILKNNTSEATTSSFKRLIICAILYDFLDLTTAILLKPAMSHFYHLCSFLLILYFCVLMFFPYYALLFVLNLCEVKYNKFLLSLPSIVLSLLVLLNPFTGWFFSIDPLTYTYNRGFLNHASYYLYGIALIIIISCSIKHRKLLGPVKIGVFISIIIISGLVMYIQVLFFNVLLTGMVMSSVILLITVIFYYSDIAFDELTGLRNQLGFKRKVKELIYFNPNEEYFLGLVELYNLQNINERLGHDFGDRILKSIAQKIYCDLETTGNVCCRFAGNTFGFFIKKDNLKSTPLNIHIKDLVPDSGNFDDLILSIYIGIYPVYERLTSLEYAFERASYALSMVRGNYYKNVCLFEGEIETSFDKKKSVEKQVWNAIKNEEFKIFLQPIFDSNTNKCVSAEALVRWIDSNNNFINPNDFIPVFEENGFIMELDMYILEHVCQIIDMWKSNNLPLIPISVNISRVDIEKLELVDEIVKVVDKHKIDHRLIKIEITESAFTHNEALLINAMNEIRDQNFLIMMDDFGSGYSNLNMFKDMPVDIVKIDMKFMEGIEDSEKGMIIVSSVVKMAKDLGLKIVVEGVETKGQYEYIKKLGCDMIQGYYFAKPMPFEDFQKQIHQ